MFRAHEEFNLFWERCADDPLLKQCVNIKAGALMRSENLYEDVIKTMCTLNCRWLNTKRMVMKMCEMFGEPCVNGCRSNAHTRPSFTFPSLDKLSQLEESELMKAGLGFRSSYVKDFVRDAAAGKLDLQVWKLEKDAYKLQEELRSIRGIGPYAANHILVLLGHYNFIPCDSEVCAFLGLPTKTKQYRVEKAAQRRYRRWGEYAFLAYKFERVLQSRN